MESVEVRTNKETWYVPIYGSYVSPELYAEKSDAEARIAGWTLLGPEDFKPDVIELEPGDLHHSGFDCETPDAYLYGNKNFVTRWPSAEDENNEIIGE